MIDSLQKEMFWQKLMVATFIKAMLYYRSVLQFGAVVSNGNTTKRNDAAFGNYHIVAII